MGGGERSLCTTKTKRLPGRWPNTNCSVLVGDFLFLRRARALFRRPAQLGGGVEGPQGPRPGGVLALLLSLLEDEPRARDSAYRRFLPPSRFPKAYR